MPGYVEALETICRDHHVGLLVPTIDDELEVIGESRPAVRTRGRSRRRVADGDRRHLQRQAANVAGAPGARRSGRRVVAACRRPGRRGVSAVRQAEERPRRRRRVSSARTRRELEFFTELRRSARRAGVPRGPRVHHRHAVQRGASARGRSPRACRHPRRRHGPRPHGARSVAHRSGARVRRGARVPRPGQHPVPDAAAASPTVFEINPRFSGGIPLTIAAGADFPRMLRRPRAGTRRSRRESATSPTGSG